MKKLTFRFCICVGSVIVCGVLLWFKQYIPAGIFALAAAHAADR